MILGDLINHVQPDRAYENLYTQLKQIVQKVISHMTDFEALLSMVNVTLFFEYHTSNSCLLLLLG